MDQRKSNAINGNSLYSGNVNKVEGDYVNMNGVKKNEFTFISRRNYIHENIHDGCMSNPNTRGLSLDFNPDSRKC